MALIKSALELALEKTVDIEVDKGELRQKELFNQGRSLGVKALAEDNDFLKNELSDLTKKLNAEETLSLKTGVLETFLGRFSLTANNDLSKEGENVSRLADLITKGKATPIVNAITAVIHRYQEEVIQLKEAITLQLGPALRQRAQQLAQQTGSQVKYIMEKDPQYIKVLNQNLDPIKNQYIQELDALKAEIKALV